MKCIHDEYVEKSINSSFDIAVVFISLRLQEENSGSLF